LFGGEIRHAVVSEVVGRIAAYQTKLSAALFDTCTSGDVARKIGF